MTKEEIMKDFWDGYTEFLSKQKDEIELSFITPRYTER